MGTLFKIGGPSSVEQIDAGTGMTLMMLLVTSVWRDPIRLQPTALEHAC